ncbi:hypothetical protein EDEG_00071 [Edhazardia aedis USNM 41457]|uniref:Uncharacterized protein n=1 Tax=Edhazardia aedis (strain USNM 41457) TaxID=1003232 RepID=J9DBT5_EDHAE|nr:hypothetical protein EDEG_00071 [Edhazardia aedis USNM 41457]|eukprot:EJW04954.1 hypothetical protein EDEG_00071 [Edhazardia aedis USNM 41457]
MYELSMFGNIKECEIINDILLKTGFTKRTIIRDSVLFRDSRKNMLRFCHDLSRNDEDCAQSKKYLIYRERPNVNQHTHFLVSNYKYSDVLNSDFDFISASEFCNFNKVRQIRKLKVIIYEKGQLFVEISQKTSDDNYIVKIFCLTSSLGEGEIEAEKLKGYISRIVELRKPQISWVLR